MKVVICWIGVSGYLAACWRALAARPGIDLRLVLFPTVGNANAPFRADLAEGLPADLLEEKHTADVERVVSLVAAHSPQIVVIPGWVVPSFKALATHPKLRGAKFILTMDTPRRDNWRLNAAKSSSSSLLRSALLLAIRPGSIWKDFGMEYFRDCDRQAM